jgi:hypothetical protein
MNVNGIAMSPMRSLRLLEGHEENASLLPFFIFLLERSESEAVMRGLHMYRKCLTAHDLT